MKEITVTARVGEPHETTADTCVLGVFEDETASHKSVAKLVESGEIKATFKKVGVAHSHGQRFVAVGLGKRADFTPERARVAAAIAAGRAAELSAKSISWTLPAPAPSSGKPERSDAHPDAADPTYIAEAIVEGTLLKAYRFDRYKTKSGDGDPEQPEADGLDALEIVAEATDGPALAAAVRSAAITTRAVNQARELQNLPGNVATPSYLADRASQIVAENELVSFEIHDRQWMDQKGMGALLAVARGSVEEPCLIELRYQGPGARGPRLGFVGKAVTFDTGGISIKPSGKMQEMKFDMSGGAAAMEAVGAIAALRLPIDVTAYVPATENMPDGGAIKPGDIVTAMNGTTIEIDNTDAEGRLVLADTLAYAVSEGVDQIIDLATLTGAIVVALGSTYAGHFSNNDGWYEQVLAASDKTGELGHRLPLHPEYLELTRGKYADLTNASPSRKASSIYAAEFLRQFVDDTAWVHVDIAGTAWDMGREYVGNGASGFGVRMLVMLARQIAEASPRLSLVSA